MDIAQLASVYKSMKSGNPAMVFQQMASNNPQMQPIIQALNGGASLTSLVDAELKKAGMSREEATQQLKNLNLL